MNYVTWIIIVVLYIALTHLIAQHIGTKRKIGYGKSVLWSILLSPVIGFIITSLSNPIDKQ
jgi:Na+-driven multidrug efflux pump